MCLFAMAPLLNYTFFGNQTIYFAGGVFVLYVSVLCHLISCFPGFEKESAIMIYCIDE